MMPVIRLSEANFGRLQKWAEPLVDSADDALSKALAAAERYRLAQGESGEVSSGLKPAIEPPGCLEVGNGPGQALEATTELYQLAREKSGEARSYLNEEVEPPEPPEEVNDATDGAQKPRLPRGVKVHNKAYEQPILEAVYELGGSGRMGAVLEIVEHKMRHMFTDVDYEDIPSGGVIRWRKTAQFTRGPLIKSGFLKGDSAWGVWELTEQGIARVEGSQR